MGKGTIEEAWEYAALRQKAEGKNVFKFPSLEGLGVG
jgi:hypothetical protein